MRLAAMALGLVAVGCSDAGGGSQDAATRCSIEAQDCAPGFVCPDYPQFARQCIPCGAVEQICCGRHLDSCRDDLTCVPSGGFEAPPTCRDCGKHGQPCCVPVVSGTDI